jgi:hypothetical protein
MFIIDLIDEFIESAREDKEKISDLQNKVLELRREKIDLLEGINSRPHQVEGPSEKELKSTIELKNNEIMTLESKVHALNLTLDQANKKIYSLPSVEDHRRLEETNHGLMEEIKHLRKTWADNQMDEIAKIDSEFSLETPQTEELARERDGLRQQVAELNGQLLTLLANSGSQQDMERLRIENIALKQNLEEMNRQSLLQPPGPQLQEDTESHQQNEALKRDNTLLKDRVEKLEAQAIEFMNRSGVSSAHKDKVVKDKLLLEVAVARLEKELTKVRAENEALRLNSSQGPSSPAIQKDADKVVSPLQAIP